MYGFAILSSMNFRETMQFAVRYHQLATPLVKLRFSEETGWAEWTIDPLPHPAVDARLYRFIVELQFGVHISLHRDVMGSSFYPSAVHVTFGPPWPEEQYERALGCPVAFRQSTNRFLYEASWLDGTPQLGNEIAYASVLALCNDLHDRLRHRVGVADKVRGLLLATLGRHMSLEDVAAHFDTRERTLRRKLRRKELFSRDPRSIAGGSCDQVLARHPDDNRRHRVCAGVQRDREFSPCVSTLETHVAARVSAKAARGRSGE